MGRAVKPFKPTWLDRYFVKGLKALREGGREDCQQRLGDLIEALEDCRHPILDPSLKRWNPTPYKGVVKLRSGVHLVEYRFPPSTMRVIACYFEERTEILLVAATVDHNHERMKRLLKEHGASFGTSFSEP